MCEPLKRADRLLTISEQVALVEIWTRQRGDNSIRELGMFLAHRFSGRSLKLPLILISALLAGCAAPNVSYWSEGKDGRGKVLIPNDQDPKFEPRLRVVEFDEQGDFWNANQVRSAQDMIDDCKRPLLVTYIHGWLNNGKPTNHDLENFNVFLKKLNDTAIGRKMQVCGLFIAWRGEGVRPEWKWLKVPYYGTFYSRKSATERVANIPLSRTLTVLSEEAHRKLGGKAIIIGHSFGGRILERTFGQWLAVEGSRNSNVESIADLVLLINPANESLYACEIKQALRGRPREARPVIVSLTSESDSATKGAWKRSADLRKAVKGSNEFRNYYRNGKTENQYTFVDKTAGHDVRQFTHWLKEVPITETYVRDNFLGWNISKAKREYFLIKAKDGTKKAYKLEPIPENGGPGDYQTPFGGYWVIQVPDDILHEHGGDPKTGGIFNAQMTDLIGAIAKVSKASEAGPPPSLSLAPIEKKNPAQVP